MTGKELDNKIWKEPARYIKIAFWVMAGCIAIAGILILTGVLVKVN